MPQTLTLVMHPRVGGFTVFPWSRHSGSRLPVVTAIEAASRRLVLGAFSDCTADGWSWSSRTAGASTSGMPTPTWRRRSEVNSPRFYRSLWRQRRPRRGLPRSSLGQRRPGRVAPDRLPQPGLARRLAPSLPPPARAARAHALARAAQQQARLPSPHLRPLRPRQRSLRALPRRVDDVLVGGLPGSRRDRSPRRSGTASSGSARRSSSGPTTTCSRSAPAGAAWRPTPPPTTAAG